MGNILVGQSGGPTAAINASLYGVFREGLANHNAVKRIYGMVNGIEGFLNGNYIDMVAEFEDNRYLEALKNTPAAFLGSCRYKLPNDTSDPIYKILFQKFAELDIEYLLYIGGNDSMDTVAKLSKYAAENHYDMKIIGVPKTIDNDLVMTDHTPGFGSAAKFVATIIREIALDVHVYYKKSVTIVELMGRHAGWLTASSVLARKFAGDNPVLIYLPEVDFDLDQFYQDVEECLEKKTNLVICVSEGIKDRDGRFICEYDQEVGTDIFGHKNLTGCGKVLENLVKERFGVKTRSIELNLPQRCSGTTASLTDINESIQAGRHAVRAAINGETGKMIAFVRQEGEGYHLNYETVDVAQVCNQEKDFPVEWITGRNNDIHPDFYHYCVPLIRGEVTIQRINGLPVYCYLKED